MKSGTANSLHFVNQRKKTQSIINSTRKDKYNQFSFSKSLIRTLIKIVSKMICEGVAVLGMGEPVASTVQSSCGSVPWRWGLNHCTLVVPFLCFSHLLKSYRPSTLLLSRYPLKVILPFLLPIDTLFSLTFH